MKSKETEGKKLIILLIKFDYKWIANLVGVIDNYE